MRRLLSLFLVLIAASVMVSATVHASELPREVMIDCGGSVHGDGDADQSQGDSDKATPHHHGTCHSSAMAVPPATMLTDAWTSREQRPAARSDQAPPSGTIAPGLRPPNA